MNFIFFQYTRLCYSRHRYFPNTQAIFSRFYELAVHLNLVCDVLGCTAYLGEVALLRKNYGLRPWVTALPSSTISFGSSLVSKLVGDCRTAGCHIDMCVAQESASLLDINSYTQWCPKVLTLTCVLMPCACCRQYWCICMFPYALRLLQAVDVFFPGCYLVW